MKNTVVIDASFFDEFIAEMNTLYTVKKIAKITQSLQWYLSKIQFEFTIYHPNIKILDR